jgi:hypothetical protein
MQEQIDFIAGMTVFWQPLFKTSVLISAASLLLTSAKAKALDFLVGCIVAQYDGCSRAVVFF